LSVQRCPTFKHEPFLNLFVRILFSQVFPYPGISALWSISPLRWTFGSIFSPPSFNNHCFFFFFFFCEGLLLPDALRPYPPDLFPLFFLHTSPFISTFFHGVLLFSLCTFSLCLPPHNLVFNLSFLLFAGVCFFPPLNPSSSGFRPLSSSGIRRCGLILLYAL